MPHAPCPFDDSMDSSLFGTAAASHWLARLH